MRVLVVSQLSGTLCVTSQYVLIGTHAGADNIFGLKSFIERESVRGRFQKLKSWLRLF